MWVTSHAGERSSDRRRVGPHPAGRPRRRARDFGVTAAGGSFGPQSRARATSCASTPAPAGSRRAFDCARRRSPPTPTPTRCGWPPRRRCCATTGEPAAAWSESPSGRDHGHHRRAGRRVGGGASHPVRCVRGRGRRPRWARWARAAGVRRRRSARLPVGRASPGRHRRAGRSADARGVTRRGPSAPQIAVAGGRSSWPATTTTPWWRSTHKAASPAASGCRGADPFAVTAGVGRVWVTARAQHLTRLDCN